MFEANLKGKSDNVKAAVERTIQRPRWNTIYNDDSARQSQSILTTPVKTWNKIEIENRIPRTFTLPGLSDIKTFRVCYSNINQSDHSPNTKSTLILVQIKMWLHYLLHFILIIQYFEYLSFYYSRSQGTIGDLNYFCIYWLWRSFITINLIGILKVNLLCIK